MPVVVGTFEQEAVGEFIPQLQVNTYRAMGIGQELTVTGMEGIFFHKILRMPKGLLRTAGPLGVWL